MLDLIFNVVAWNFFLRYFSMPEPTAGSPPAMFLGAMIPTGYFAFVKVLEITGGILVAIPRTRPLGLLTLGPVIVNILCFHIFLTKSCKCKVPASRRALQPISHRNADCVFRL